MVEYTQGIIIALLQYTCNFQYMYCNITVGVSTEIYYPFLAMGVLLWRQQAGPMTHVYAVLCFTPAAHGLLVRMSLADVNEMKEACFGVSCAASDWKIEWVVQWCVSNWAYRNWVTQWAIDACTDMVIWLEAVPGLTNIVRLNLRDLQEEGDIILGT